MLSCTLQKRAKPTLQISREKKTKKIFITSDQLCWAWCLEDHPSCSMGNQATLKQWPKHHICTKCSTSCCHVLFRKGLNPHCKSAGKRRQKRFSSQVISSVELDNWKIILHAALRNQATLKQWPKHHICTKCSTACCHVLLRRGLNPHCKSAGKRRRKRFSSQVISSVELDVWKIILHAAWEIKQHSSSDLSTTSAPSAAHHAAMYSSEKG